MAVTQMQRNAKLLYKKITMNKIIKDAFVRHLLEKGHFSQEMIKKQEYISDLLFLNILDQIFVQTVYMPHM